MLLFLIVFFGLIITSLVFFFILLIGEHFSEKYPNSNFKKWWSRNIITEINYDDEL